MKKLIRGPEITLTKELQQVWLKEGEFLAVFFTVPGGGNKFVQVELRNSNQYGMEIFADPGDGLVVKPFDEFKPLD